MPGHTSSHRQRCGKHLSLGGLALTLLLCPATTAQPRQNWLTPQPKPAPQAPRTAPATPCPVSGNPDPLLGPRTRMPGRWVGRGAVKPDLPIVVMAGHADSQAMASAGTPGFAVDKRRQAPMDPRMRDELYWNLQVQKAVVRLGRTRGLNISAYTPPALTIRNDEDPRTNWSQAKTRSARGDYILEIHFDAYRPYGFGSGLIPAINRPLNALDESLAQAFGRFPRLFRGGLGGPRRGIGIPELAMLGAPLESKLRNPSTRSRTLECIAERVVNALVQGVS